MDGKVVVITGANSGIGRESARLLAGDGATVVMVARNADRGREAVEAVRASTGNPNVHLELLDLASLASTRRGAEAILARFPRIDVLMNNAGLVLSERTVTEDGLEATFQINHLGHFLLTALLREALVAAAPARVINVASLAHRAATRGLDFEDLQSERRYRFFDVYAKSKLANLLFTRELARRLEGTGVTANGLHPGTIASGFARDGDAKGLFGFLVKVGAPLLTTPEKGADTQTWLARAPEVAEVTGEYFVRRRVRRPSAHARDDAAAARLWEASERLVAPAFG